MAKGDFKLPRRPQEGFSVGRHPHCTPPPHWLIGQGQGDGEKGSDCPFQEECFGVSELAERNQAQGTYLPRRGGGDQALRESQQGDITKEQAEHRGGVLGGGGGAGASGARGCLCTLHNGVRCGPDAVVQSISGLDPAHSLPCDPVTHQASVSLLSNSRGQSSRAPYSSLLSFGGRHREQDSELHTKLGITAYPEKSGWVGGAPLLPRLNAPRRTQVFSPPLLPESDVGLNPFLILWCG